MLILCDKNGIYFWYENNTYVHLMPSTMHIKNVQRCTPNHFIVTPSDQSEEKALKMSES